MSQQRFRIPILEVSAWIVLALLTAGVARTQLKASYLGIDINKDPTPTPSADFYPNYARRANRAGERKFIRLNNAIYFSGKTFSTGSELWKFDGTKVSLVKDIYPGSSSSNPQYLTLYNGKIYFSASDGSGTRAHGRELWVTDGTPAGTKLFMDVEPGRSGSNPSFFAPLANGKIVFAGYKSGYGNELWVTDGTRAGTKMLKDINPGRLSSSPLALTPNAARTKVFFPANDGVNGIELWVTDGTSTGTVLVKDIYKGLSSSNPSYLTPIGTRRVVFQASDYDGTTQHGVELWISDGTAAGTMLLKDVYTGYLSGTSLYPGISLGSKVIFQGRTSANGYEVWVTDGTAAGTVLLKDIVAGAGSAYLYESTTSGKKAWFVNCGGGKTFEIWSTDGTPAGTTRFISGLASQPSYLEVSGGKVFFSMYTTGNGNEPWVSDGTAGGTKMLKDFYPGSSSGGGYYLTEVAPGQVAMSAYSPTEGSELAVTQGTTETTTIIDTNKWTYGPISQSEHIVQMTSHFGRILFSANDGASNGKHGQELWVTKGTSATTKLVKDILPGTNSGISYYGNSFCRLGDKVLFAANSGWTTGNELWETDGTAAGTKLLKDLYPGILSSNPSNLTRIGDKVYFQAYAYRKGVELWVTDGTAAGTKMVADIYSGFGSSRPSWFAPLGDKVVFSAYQSGKGYELWITDGTATGTTLVKDIYAGSFSSSPEDLTVYNGKVYFSAYDGTRTGGHGRELWVTDGTAAGTVLVKDIESGAGSSSPVDLVVQGGLLVFSAYTSTTGREFFKSDGTAAGTGLYFQSGSVPLTPYKLTKVGSRRIYFSGNSGAGGREPMIVTFNGTTPTKVLSFDYAPGGLSSNPYNYTEGKDMFCLDSGRVFMKGNMNPSSDERIFRFDNGATTHSIGDVRGSTILTGDKDPVLNTTVNLKGTTGISNPIHVLILSAPTETPIKVFPHWYAYYDPSKQIVLGAWSGVSFTSSLRIPNNKNLKGLRVVVQDWVLNAKTAPAGWELSNGLFMVLGT